MPHAPLDKHRMAKQLRVHEGVRRTVYRDTEGILTIGVGRNLEDKGLTNEEINFLLRNDIDEYERGVRDNFPPYRNLNVARKMVLVDMAFNLGVAGLLEFENMLDAVEDGDWDTAAAEMLDSLWARKQVGSRAQRLSQMMKTGEPVW